MPLLRTGKVILGLAVVFLSAALLRADATFQVPPIAAGIMLSDNQTLVVSVPSKGLLIYFDTVADKEIKRLEVDFQPAFLAAQGKNLFVSAKGAATVYVLEADTAKEVKKIKVSGEPVSALACHPKTGLLYSVNTNNEVFAIDTEKGEATKTAAKGQLIAIAPEDGNVVYTGIQKPIKDQIVVRGNTITFGQANLRAFMLKYKVDGKDLQLDMVNDNAAINGRAMAVSADGKQIAMAGGGGWRSKTDPKANYAIASFDASDMNSLLGQVETGAYPEGIVFHPVLKLGAALHGGGTTEIMVFNSKSYVVKDTLKFKAAGPGGPSASPLLMIGGQGTKVIYATMPLGIGAKDVSDILFFPITLTDADKATLKKTYSK